MGACCSTEEDKDNINIDNKSGQNKKPTKGKKGGKCWSPAVCLTVSFEQFGFEIFIAVSNLKYRRVH